MIATLPSSRVNPNHSIETDIDVSAVDLNPDDHLVSHGCAGFLREPDQISRPADPAGSRKVNMIVAEPTKLPCFRTVEAHDWTFVDSVRESLDKYRFSEIIIGHDVMVRWMMLT